MDCCRPLNPSALKSGNKRCPSCARQWRETARCVTCGADLSKRRAVRYCSKRCCDVDRGLLLAEPLPRRACALPECGLEFQPQADRQQCCCEDHGKKLCRIRYQAEGRVYKQTADQRRGRDQRRRALKKGATVGEPFTVAEIRERDGNRCHLCRKKVSSKPWPHPLSESLDHVIPLTRGGLHERSNVRIAHLDCNTRKGNRGGNEQLLLIG